MPRISQLTYEQVASAIDTLIASGRRPSLRALRSMLGSGSLSSISVHVKTWEAQHPSMSPATPPSEVLNELADQGSKVWQHALIAARASMSQELTALQKDLADHESVAEELRTALTTTEERCAVEAERRAAAEAQLATLTTQMQEWQRLLGDAQAAAERARADAAAAAHRHEEAVLTATRIEEERARVASEAAAQAAAAAELRRHLDQARHDLAAQQASHAEQVAALIRDRDSHVVTTDRMIHERDSLAAKHEQDRRRVAQLELEIGNACSRAEAADRSKAAVEAHVASLREELALEQQARSGQAETLQGTLANLVQEVGRLRQHIADLPRPAAPEPPPPAGGH